MTQSRLALGTAQFSGSYGIARRGAVIDRQTTHSILERAWTGGVRYLDTAPAYGSAMELIGDFHKGQSMRFSIMSKFLVCDGNEKFDNFKDGIEKQLEILNVEQIEVLYFHRFQQVIDYPQCLDNLNELKSLGLIHKIGVSIYDNAELEIASKLELDVIQLPYNVLDNWANRGKYIELACARGKELHARSVFLQGLLLLKQSEIPIKLHPLCKYINRIGSLIDNQFQGILPLAKLFSYVYNRPEFKLAIVGVDSEAQLDEILNLSCEAPIDPQIEKLISLVAVAEVDLLNPSKWNL